MSHNSGIYIITTPSGKQYVGSAVNFSRRWANHRNSLIYGTHHNKPLQAAFNKYGIDGLVFAKLIICDKKDLLLYEQIAIDALNPQCNVLKIAGSALGMKLSDEAREKIRRAATNISDETRAKRSAANARRVQSAETRAKISAAKKGGPGRPRTTDYSARLVDEHLYDESTASDPWTENISRGYL